MSRKTIALIVVVAGIALVIVSALADVIGIGGGGGFGLRQVSGVIVGVLAVAFGWLFGFRKPSG